MSHCVHLIDTSLFRYRCWCSTGRPLSSQGSKPHFAVTYHHHHHGQQHRTRDFGALLPNRNTSFLRIGNSGILSPTRFKSSALASDLPVSIYCCTVLNVFIFYYQSLRPSSLQTTYPFSSASHLHLTITCHCHCSLMLYRWPSRKLCSGPLNWIFSLCLRCIYLSFGGA